MSSFHGFTKHGVVHIGGKKLARSVFTIAVGSFCIEVIIAFGTHNLVKLAQSDGRGKLLMVCSQFAISIYFCLFTESFSYGYS